MWQSRNNGEHLTNDILSGDVEFIAKYEKGKNPWESRDWRRQLRQLQAGDTFKCIKHHLRNYGNWRDHFSTWEEPEITFRPTYSFSGGEYKQIDPPSYADRIGYWQTKNTEKGKLWKTDSGDYCEDGHWQCMPATYTSLEAVTESDHKPVMLRLR